MNIPNHVDFLRRLCRAVGIDPDKTAVERLVIEASADDVVRVYVQQVHQEKPDEPTVDEVMRESVDKDIVPCVGMKVDKKGALKFQTVRDAIARMMEKAGQDLHADFVVAYSQAMVKSGSGLLPETIKTNFLRGTIKRGWIVGCPPGKSVEDVRRELCQCARLMAHCRTGEFAEARKQAADGLILLYVECWPLTVTQAPAREADEFGPAQPARMRISERGGYVWVTAEQKAALLRGEDVKVDAISGLRFNQCRIEEGQAYPVYGERKPPTIQSPKGWTYHEPDLSVVSTVAESQQTDTTEGDAAFEFFKQINH